MSRAPLAGLRFSLAGPGKVGRSLAGWAVAAGAELVSVAGRGPVSLPALAADPTRTALQVPLDELATAGENLLLLALPDAFLGEAALRLSRRPQARVALHTAGALDSAVLAPLRAAGSTVGGFHPLKAFPRPLPDPGEARGIFLGLDGDPEALALGRRLAAAWGATAGEIPPADRPLYHLAASLAAGGAVTLLAAASDLARTLGLPPEVGPGYAALARGAIEAAVAADDPAAALTGPVARGDLPLLVRQLEALAAISPERVPLVLQLARETLRQVARLGPLNPAQQALLAEVERRLGP